MDGAAMLPELDRELATTRRVLERVPFERAEWSPHPKSMPLAKLAGHLCDDPLWLGLIVEREAVDFETLDLPPPPRTLEETLARFDEAAIHAREALRRTTQDHLARNWSVRQGGTALMTMPRREWIRRMTLNHMIHHRGQMTVYLRMCGAPVPAIYGPSADES